MKSYRLKMRKIAFGHGYRFRKLLRGLLCVSLCVCTGSFLTSCGPVPTVPRETYVKNSSLSGISKVAVVASVSAPEVSYSAARNNVSENLLFFTGPAAFLVVLGTEKAIRSGVDHGHAGDVKKHVDLSYFEEKIAQSFMQTLMKSNCFRSTEYLTDKNEDARRLSSKGYDAIIRLFVREISLKRIEGDSVRLNVYVRGSMEYLSSGKVVWDREEHVLSPERHSLDYYKENGLKELDAMLEKAGRNLAYDFVYLN